MKIASKMTSITSCKLGLSRDAVNFYHSFENLVRSLEVSFCIWKVAWGRFFFVSRLERRF